MRWAAKDGPWEAETQGSLPSFFISIHIEPKLCRNASSNESVAKMNVEGPATPGERWLANLQPIGETERESIEGTVTLVDFDPRTETWTVKREGEADTIALLASHLIRRRD
jgi:hypothetical protein